jgi:hypothetical protein
MVLGALHMDNTLNIEKLDFGDSAADHETSLSSYFYQNQLFDSACNAGICLVLGEKGAGKSAIFRMMRDKSQEIPSLRNPNFFIGTLANLREHFQLLQNKFRAPISYVTLWKFYFASIVALQLLDTSGGKEGEFLQKFVDHWELNALKFPTFFGGTIRLPLKIAEVEVKRSGDSAPTPLQLQEVFGIANRILLQESNMLWIALDELDKVAINGNGAKDHSLEVLSALMQTHSELFPLDRIRFKLFIRSDVYESLTYVDKDHFTNSILRLKWEPEELAIMLALRIRASSGEISGALSLKDAHDLINRVFDWPEQAASFEDVLGELRDGRDLVTPRDLLNFAIKAKLAQKRFNSFGTDPPSKGIISASAVEQGLKDASQAKLEDFLTTFPNVHSRFMNLQGHSSPRLPRKELQKLLNIPEALNLNLALDEFWRIGAVGKKGNKPVHLTDEFDIPPIYRRALNLKMD